MAEPVVRWIGGKGRLLPELVARLPATMKVYHEPFLGGGALYFALAPQFAYLADANPELVNLYRVIKREPVRLMALMATMNATEAEFYRLRGLDRQPDFTAIPDVARAARFVFLNKTCFNGLHRVNRRGHFNASWGKRRDPTLFVPGTVMAVHEALRGARIAQAGFEAVASLARRGDFVYFDPPYDSDDGAFTAYAQDSFGRAEQRRLWQVCVKLHRMGVKWMLSNSDTPFVRGLFAAFSIDAIRAPRSVAAKGSARMPAAEVIVRNY